MADGLDANDEDELRNDPFFAEVTRQGHEMIGRKPPSKETNVHKDAMAWDLI